AVQALGRAVKAETKMPIRVRVAKKKPTIERAREIADDLRYRTREYLIDRGPSAIKLGIEPFRPGGKASRYRTGTKRPRRKRRRFAASEHRDHQLVRKATFRSVNAERVRRRQQFYELHRFSVPHKLREGLDTQYVLEVD